MRLSGPLFDKYDGPEEWVNVVRSAGYRAAFCPLSPDSADEEISSYVAAAKEADIIIAEVGAWSNPLSSDEPTRRDALDKCKKALGLAEKVGARCCVNISGSRGERWDGPDPLNLTPETFAMIVETVREIIDAVNPCRTFYTLETMPWMYPDSVESYLDLIRAIDRKAFAVHFDPVNLVNSTRLYFGNGDLIRDFVARLGPHIRSCHAKDIHLRDTLTLHLDEVCPGTGGLDYNTYLRELSKLDKDTSLFIEHMSGPEEYQKAGEFIRKIAEEEGVDL